MSTSYVATGDSNQLWIQDGAAGREWIHHSYSIPMMEQSYQIEFTAVRGNGQGITISIDDITVMNGEWCTSRNGTCIPSYSMSTYVTHSAGVTSTSRCRHFIHFNVKHFSSTRQFYQKFGSISFTGFLLPLSSFIKCLSVVIAKHHQFHLSTYVTCHT